MFVRSTIVGLLLPHSWCRSVPREPLGSGALMGQTQIKREWLQLRPIKHHHIGNNKKHNLQVVCSQLPHSEQPSQTRKTSLRVDYITCYAPFLTNVITKTKWHNIDDNTHVAPTSSLRQLSNIPMLLVTTQNSPEFCRALPENSH